MPRLDSGPGAMLMLMLMLMLKAGVYAPPAQTT
jgi:hypothetical protein